MVGGDDVRWLCTIVAATFTISTFNWHVCSLLLGQGLVLYLLKSILRLHQTNIQHILYAGHESVAIASISAFASTSSAPNRACRECVIVQNSPRPMIEQSDLSGEFASGFHRFDRV